MRRFNDARPLRLRTRQGEQYERRPLLGLLSVYCATSDSNILLMAPSSTP